MRILMMIIALVLCLGLAQRPRHTQNVRPDLDGILDLLGDRQISRIEILHVSDHVTTLVNLTPEGLRRICRSRVTIELERESPQIEGLSTALKEVESSQDAGDLRWAILFFDRTGNERGAIFFDRFGEKGVLNNRVISLKGRLLVWTRQTIRKAFLETPAQ